MGEGPEVATPTHTLIWSPSGCWRMKSGLPSGAPPASRWRGLAGASVPGMGGASSASSRTA
ncbi:MAG: hypothetical protein R3F14_26400 [Polyangiaceae bacterium]